MKKGIDKSPMQKNSRRRAFLPSISCQELRCWSRTYPCQTSSVPSSVDQHRACRLPTAWLRWFKRLQLDHRTKTTQLQMVQSMEPHLDSPIYQGPLGRPLDQH